MLLKRTTWPAGKGFIFIVFQQNFEVINNQHWMTVVCKEWVLPDINLISYDLTLHWAKNNVRSSSDTIKGTSLILYYNIRSSKRALWVSILWLWNLCNQIDFHSQEGRVEKIVLSRNRFDLTLKSNNSKGV